MTTGPVVYVALGDSTGVGVGARDGRGYVARLFGRLAENFEQILSTLKKKTHATIVVTNVPDISSAPRIPDQWRGEYQRQIEQFCKRSVEIANRHGVTVFDIYTITKKELPSHPEYFSPDGFHPSDQGYELWASQMWPTVAEASDATE